MSSATVATIACLALVAAGGMAVWVALQQRRTDELARSLTARKWDIVTLRAEVAALRRQLHGAAAAPSADDAERSAEPVDRDGVPAPRTPGTSRSPAGSSPSPTAWRRDRARGAAASRPRRRRLF